MSNFDGRKLRERRENADRTPTEFAADIGYSAMTLWRYENGITYPPADVVGLMAELLGCHISDLFSDGDRVA
jgi:transcriptional regulator with XRE-family HTH domain